MQYTISDVERLIHTYSQALNDPNIDNENKEMFAKEITMLEDLLKFMADDALIKCRNCECLVTEYSRKWCSLLNKEVNPEMDFCSEFIPTKKGDN